MKRNEPKKSKTTETEALLRELLSAFTQRAGDIKIETRTDEAGELITLDVHQEDYGKVVGSMGRTIQALRTVSEFIGARDGKKITLILTERPRPAFRTMPAPFQPSEKWSPEPMRKLLDKVLSRIFTRDMDIEISSSRDTTNIDIKADPAEQDVAEALVPHLQPIFHAIGKQQGRHVYLAASAKIPKLAKA